MRRTLHIFCTTFALVVSGAIAQAQIPEPSPTVTPPPQSMQDEIRSEIDKLKQTIKSLEERLAAQENKKTEPVVTAQTEPQKETEEKPCSQPHDDEEDRLVEYLVWGKEAVLLPCPKCRPEAHHKRKEERIDRTKENRLRLVGKS